jgi:phage/plasmid-like protein (TIGR03299 family)
MAHEVETMAYSRSVGTPWHGLGEMIEDGSSVEQMEKAAKLDWRVERRKVFMSMDRDNPTKMEIPGRFALTRNTDRKVYQFVTDEYHPVQNREILSFFKSYCEAGEMQIKTAGSLRNGALVWAMASVNHGSDFSLGGGDVVKANIVLVTSHDGSLQYQGFDTSISVYA